MTIDSPIDQCAFSPWAKELEIAERAARAAGAELIRLWQEPMNSRYKGLRDLVTTADTIAEEIIIHTIRDAFSDHAILSEESGQMRGSILSAEGEAGDGHAYQWIIDPLDGTTNYARQVPFFCVSIALADGDIPILGVLFDPVHGALYHAVRGQGAFRNGRRLNPSWRDDMMDFVVGTDWPRQEDRRQRMLQAILDSSPRIGSWRSLGSAALGLAFVANGIFDAYVHGSLHPWDLAAAGLLVEEAGGCITALNGSREWWREHACLASNGRRHEDLLAFFVNVLDEEPRKL